MTGTRCSCSRTRKRSTSQQRIETVWPRQPAGSAAFTATGMIQGLVLAAFVLLAGQSYDSPSNASNVWATITGKSRQMHGTLCTDHGTRTRSVQDVSVMGTGTTSGAPKCTEMTLIKTTEANRGKYNQLSLHEHLKQNLPSMGLCI